MQLPAIGTQFGDRSGQIWRVTQHLYSPVRGNHTGQRTRIRARNPVDQDLIFLPGVDGEWYAPLPHRISIRQLEASKGGNR